LFYCADTKAKGTAKQSGQTASCTGFRRKSAHLNLRSPKIPLRHALI
jgi:hypothetical protein